MSLSASRICGRLAVDDLVAFGVDLILGFDFGVGVVDVWVGRPWLLGGSRFRLIRNGEAIRKRETL